MTPALYHFTCSHGYAKIGAAGKLRPASSRIPGLRLLPGRFVWLTDLAVPVRDALGLTSTSLQCDRTEHRYRVVDPQNPEIIPWSVARRKCDRAQVLALESAPGAQPDHWWVATIPVRVVLDPYGGLRWTP